MLSQRVLCSVIVGMLAGACFRGPSSTVTSRLDRATGELVLTGRPTQTGPGRAMLLAENGTILGTATYATDGSFELRAKVAKGDRIGLQFENARPATQQERPLPYVIKLFTVGDDGALVVDPGKPSE